LNSRYARDFALSIFRDTLALSAIVTFIAPSYLRNGTRTLVTISTPELLT